MRDQPAPGHLVIQNNRTGCISYWQNEYHQSACDSRGISTADYIHAMFWFLRQAKSRKVLMIGCGGGTLATMLRRCSVEVVIIDIKKLSFDIARKYFHLPPEVTCRVSDGSAYLRKSRQCYDAIILDAFGGSGMPKKFERASFFRLAKSRLKPRASLFLMNVIVADDDDKTPDRLVRLMRHQWNHVRLLDTDGWIDRNAVILAGAVRKLTKPKLLLAPQWGRRKLAAELSLLNFRSIR